MREITNVGESIAEGKTKQIFATDDPNIVHIRSKDDITAGDGAKHDILEGKAIAATETTCNVFELINRVSVVPTHYLDRVDEAGFRAIKARMTPIEIVARRIAYGSYLKRNPDTPAQTKFPRLVVEFFYKDDDAHDPIMIWDEETKTFALHDAKQPVSAASFIRKLDPAEITGLAGLGYPPRIILELMRLMVASVFETLEKAWLRHEMVLVDLKIECGWDAGFRQPMVADVIDNDSWRLWHCGDPTTMLDKQVYRDLATDDPELKAAAMAKIRDNYEWVAKLTKTFVV